MGINPCKPPTPAVMEVPPLNVNIQFPAVSLLPYCYGGNVKTHTRLLGAGSAMKKVGTQNLQYRQITENFTNFD